MKNKLLILCVMAFLKVSVASEFSKNWNIPLFTEDALPQGSASCDTCIEAVVNIDSLIRYSGNSSQVFVLEELRGGVFSYVQTETVDSGIVFPATGQGSGYWIRKIYSRYLYAEWWGGNDGSSLQKAIDFNANPDSTGYIVTARSATIETGFTISIPVKNYAIDLINTEIRPNSSFPDGDTLVNIDGEFQSDDPNTIYSRIKVNGLDTARGIIGILLSVKLVPNHHEFAVFNCDVGLYVYDHCEKQNIHIGAGGCKTAVALVQGPTGGDNDPDENVFHITGGRCITYFHEQENTTASSIVHLNTENSWAGGYSIISQGRKNLIVRGIDRFPKGGSIYADGAALSLSFDGFTIRSSRLDTAVFIEQADQIHGSLNIVDADAGAVYMGRIDYGGVLDLSLSQISNSTGLILGNSSRSAVVNNMLINYSASFDDNSESLLLDSVHNTQVVTPNHTYIDTTLSLQSKNDTVLHLSSSSEIGIVKISNPNSNTYINNLPTTTSIGKNPEESIDNITISQEGKLGIGQIAPSAPLHVEDSTENVTAVFKSGDGQSYASFMDNNTADQFESLIGTRGGNLELWANGSELVRLTDSMVGVGTTSPSSQLDVAGDVEIDGWIYFGDPDTDGSWRMGVTGSDFLHQKREAEVWVTKVSILTD